MENKTATTGLILSNDSDDQTLIFASLENFLKHLLEQLKCPLHYYETLRHGIEKFPRLGTVDRIDLLKKLIFVTKQFYNISTHNLQDLLLGQLEREREIFAYENESGKTVVVTGENSNICTLDSPKLIVFNSTVTELGHRVGEIASTTREKNGQLMFLSERETVAEIASLIFVDIHGVKVNYNSILRYIKESWINMQNPSK